VIQCSSTGLYEALAMNSLLKNGFNSALKLTCFPYNSYWSQYKYQDSNVKTYKGLMQKQLVAL
jgi:hypothetical protein